MKKITSIFILILIGLSLCGFTNQSNIKEIPLDAEQIGSSFYENVLMYKSYDWSTNTTGIGFIDKNGKIVISPKYTSVSNFSEGVAAVIQNDKLFYIDKKGNVVLNTNTAPYEFNIADSAYLAKSFSMEWFKFSSDRTIKYDKEKDKWGYMNKKGEIVIPCEYTYVEPFKDGLAIVKKDGKFGVINTQGEYIVELGKYSMVNNLSSGYIEASNDFKMEYLTNQFDLINDKGEIVKNNIAGYTASEVSEGCFAVKEEEKVVVYNIDGTIRFSLPIFENEDDYEKYRMLWSVGKSSEGLMLVEYCDSDSETLYGYIDSNNGGLVIQPQYYENAFDFSNGIAIVNKEGLYGAIDRGNNIVIPFEYDEWKYLKGSYDIYSSDGVVPLCSSVKCVLVKHNVSDIDNIINEKYMVKGTLACLNILGKDVKVDAYNIKGNNYFKLRDLAVALSEHENKFGVQWDESKKAIQLQSGVVQQGNIQITNQAESQLAIPNKATLYKDGVLVQMEAYNINGNTYFKLRDIGNLFGFKVNWDAENNKIVV